MFEVVFEAIGRCETILSGKCKGGKMCRSVLIDVSNPTLPNVVQ